MARSEGLRAAAALLLLLAGCATQPAGKWSDGERAYLDGRHTDAELIGASMYEVEPGNKQGPFHTHHANEEWAIVLRGEPTLRTHEGEQQLRQGDVVAFPRGKEGAHQIRNDTDVPVRVLMLSTLIAPDIVEYLDTGKIGARSVAGERIIFARAMSFGT